MPGLRRQSTVSFEKNERETLIVSHKSGCGLSQRVQSGLSDVVNVNRPSLLPVKMM
jgi:hypothetical protein